MFEFKLSRRSFSLAAACAALPGTWAPAAQAEEIQAERFPDHPIRFIIPFPPGSGTDNAARLFAKKIGELSGQAVVVENKPGGNGIIGVQSVLNAPADGYTVFIGSNSTLSTNVALFKSLPYDPLADFTPITVLTQGPCFIIVPTTSPYRTIKDLIDDARKRPDALTYGSGSVSYKLYCEWFNHTAGIKTREIPYKGAGDAIKAVAGGEVDFAVVDGSGSTGLIKGGRVRGLVHTAKRRSTLVPDVPDSIEAGIPEYLAYNWVAAAVSAKTPSPIVKKISDLFFQAGNSADLRDYYSNQPASLLLSTAQEMRDYQREEIARWKHLAALAHIEPQ